jgi:DNA polymerase I-like protein with 3'-5' exonuclease and polymerase domains
MAMGDGMNIITTEKQLKEVVKAYMKQDAFVFDVETLGDFRGDPRRNTVAWIAMATEGRVDVIPMGHPNGEYIRTDYPLLPSAKVRVEKGLPLRPSDYSRDERKAVKVFGEAPEQLTPKQVFDALSPLFEDDSKLKVGHNLKFDLQSVAKYFGFIPAPTYACTLVASFILDNRTNHNLGLDDCLKREFNYDMVKGVGKKIEEYDFNSVATYAGLDAEWTWKLWKQLEERLNEKKMRKLYNLEMDVLGVLCSMELRGADIDLESLRELKVNLEKQLEDTKAKIYRAAGRPFNINSNSEKQKILFGSKKNGGIGLSPKITTPKGAPAVSSEALDKLRGKHALVDALLEYSDLNKLMTTYVIPYLGGDITRTLNGKAKILAKESILINGRVHTDFVQYGTETGRFSSRNPNLQNIPNPRTENGKAIRNLFVAPEGHKLIVADYSQIEPRIIASFSKDRVMVQSYLDGEDIYTAIANALNVDRAAGKILILSMSYGVGPDKIAGQIGVTPSEAKKLLNDFERKFPSLTRYKAQVVMQSRSKSPVPYAETILKRRRYLPELRSKEVWERARAERQAFNTVIQGSAADLIKVAMVRADSMIPEGARLILTVHDELVTVAPSEIADETAQAIKEAMEGMNVLSVPLIADVKIVNRWGEAK